MPLISYAEFRPDVSDYLSQHSSFLANVLPRGDGYGPFPGLAPYSMPMSGAARGFFRAIRPDGSVAFFSGTATTLQLLDNSTTGWRNVSRGGAYVGLPGGDNWEFAQFNNFVFAIQVNVPLQVFDLRTDVQFHDAFGGPPAAKRVTVVGRFLVLSAIQGNPYRVQWSGLNDVNSGTSWTPGVNSSDFQDMADGGIVKGVAGGEFGLIMSDYALRRMTFMPGSAVIFQIEKLADDIGLLAPYSLLRTTGRVFFLSPLGFMGMQSTDPAPTPIGKERIDRSFLSTLDAGNLQLMMGAADPRSSRAFWAYRSMGAAVAPGLFDRVIGYDWALDRWFPVILTGEYLGSFSQPGITLEGLDAISGSIDALPLSLDAYASSTTPQLACFDSLHRLGIFQGPALEAALDTGEQGADGQRLFVRGFRVISDAPAVFGSASARETQNAAPVYSAEQAINILGNCDLRVDTRFSRARVRIPAGTTWTVSRGIEPDARPVGRK